MNGSLNIPVNASVKWSGNRFGYTPSFSEKIKNIIKNKKIGKPELFAAMLEEDKFITAHVILTLVSNMKFEAFPTWNKLKIEIDADGQVNIDTEQRFQLLEYWKSKLSEINH